LFKASLATALRKYNEKSINGKELKKNKITGSPGMNRQSEEKKKKKNELQTALMKNILQNQGNEFDLLESNFNVKKESFADRQEKNVETKEDNSFVGKSPSDNYMLGSGSTNEKFLRKGYDLNTEVKNFIKLEKNIKL
jgi:hypothetical protein